MYARCRLLHWLPFPQPTSHARSRPIGVAVLVWLGALLSAALPLLVQAVVHCEPLSTVILWSNSPAQFALSATIQTLYFLWLVQQPGMDFQHILGASQTVSVLNSTIFSRLLFRLAWVWSVSE